MKVLENPFGCSVCRKPFSDPFELAEHVKIAHNNSLNNSMADDISNQFNCQNCDMKFNTQHGLNIHQTLVHEVEKTLSCKFCDKKFKNSQTLKSHENRHTGNEINTFLCFKAFSCDL